MASPFTLPAMLNPPMNGREAVTDALHRSAMAFDTNDASLFDSSFMQDGIFEINGRPMTGLTEIHAIGLPLIFSVDTTHMVSNVRVHMGSAAEEENTASLTATVLSQHFALGKGMEPGQTNLIAGSFYRGDLVKDVDGLWKFKLLKVQANWSQGDFSIIGGKFEE